MAKPRRETGGVFVFPATGDLGNIPAMKILLVLYVLTFGPVIWLMDSTQLSDDAMRAISQAYAPLIERALKENSATGKCLRWWACAVNEDAWLTLWVIKPSRGSNRRNLGVDD